VDTVGVFASESLGLFSIRSAAVKFGLIYGVVGLLRQSISVLLIPVWILLLGACYKTPTTAKQTL
jgi:hypothetical protein